MMSSANPTTAAGPARTLADQLRSWPDDRLALLLRARPDLASPTPRDSAHLASRAASRASLLRALEGLDQLELHVLDALVVLGDSSPDRLGASVYAAPEAVAKATERLVGLGLVWHGPRGLRSLSGVADGRHGGVAGASGLRPVQPGALSPAEVADRLARVGPQARALLDHLEAHGGEGTLEGAGAGTTVEDADPVGTLLAERLLLARERGRVWLPGEVALVLRGGRTTRDPVDAPPALATRDRDPALVARAAGGTAFEVVRRVELLLDQWAVRPPAVLRAGGLGVRDLRAAAALLHADPEEAALLVEAAAAARLLAPGVDAGGDPCWLPTDAFDRWTARAPAERWAVLARAWLDSDRTVGAVGSREASGKALNALAAELTSAVAAETRRSALLPLAELPAGAGLAEDALGSLLEVLRWRRPRRPRTRERLVVWSIREAAVLGVTGLGVLTDHGRALLAGDDERAAALLTPLLPEPVDHVLIQADLTAVAPGPLEASVSHRLHEMAAVESRGSGTVYRFTAASVRGALDLGWSAHELHAFLGEVSRTPVPQPLTYLVDDTARSHGTVRAGHAEAFLRSDDDVALAEVLHLPQAGSWGLRRLAPTVLVSSTPLDVLLPRLRAAGIAVVVEAPDGSVHVPRPDRRRARTPKGRADVAGGATDPVLPAARAEQVVRAVRAGDRAGSARPEAGEATTTPGGTLAALREAVEAASPVWIGYADSQGTVSERIVEPTSVEGGVLTGYDHRSQDTRTFSVHRITGARRLASEERPPGGGLRRDPPQPPARRARP